MTTTYLEDVHLFLRLAARSPASSACGSLANLVGAAIPPLVTPARAVARSYRNARAIFRLEAEDGRIRLGTACTHQNHTLKQGSWSNCHVNRHEDTEWLTH